MRILILGINYWPEETGIGAFSTYRAEFLAQKGHDVTVCTTFPYYPEWKVAPGYAGKILQREEHKSVRIVRTWAYVPAKVSSMKRILHEASFIVSSFFSALLQKRPDVLLVVSPPLGLGISARILSLIWKVPYVFDVEDLQPDAAADLGMLPPRLLRLMYRVESFAYRHAARVSTLTRGMWRRIAEKGLPPEKVELFEPRADESLMGLDTQSGAAFRKKFGLESKLIVSHSGNMGVKQGLEIILESAAMCKHDSSLVFVIVGDGAMRRRIESRAEELQLHNLKLLPLLETDEFRSFLSATDICLVTQLRSVSDIVFPSKTVTYLAAGRPVIASVNAGSEIARTIQESGAGVVVEPESAEALVNAIQNLRSGDLFVLGATAKKYAADRWSSERVLGHLESTLARVAAEGYRGGLQNPSTGRSEV